MNLFKENYQGILTHDGWIKVAKFNIEGKILNISDEGLIQVKTHSDTSWICDVHKKLKKDVKFMEVGDTVGLKMNCGNIYVVGFKKSTAEDDVEYKPSGDKPISENTNWMGYHEP